MSVVTGTSKAGNGGAPAPGGDGPVDISNWNMYGRASSGRPVVWLVGPVVGTCTETSARCVCVEGAAVFVARFFAIGDLLVSSEDVG